MTLAFLLRLARACVNLLRLRAFRLAEIPRVRVFNDFVERYGRARALQTIVRVERQLGCAP
jgi:hypothetical protein